MVTRNQTRGFCVPFPYVENSYRRLGFIKTSLDKRTPREGKKLDLYERDIIDIATKYPGKGFNEYHRQFSLMAASHLKYNNILMIGQYETILFFVTCLQTIENKLAPHAIVLCIYLDFVH